MSLFSFFKRRKPQPVDLRIEPQSLPTVKFDQRLVTKAVKGDLAKTIAMLNEIPSSLKDGLYKEALKSAPERDLGSLTQYILALGLNDMSKPRAAELARFIGRRTGASIDKENRRSLGITEAIWLHSGAPCGIAPDFVIDTDHRAANGKKYSISVGMQINGECTWPGWDRGCKCISRPLVKGFS